MRSWQRNVAYGYQKLSLSNARCDTRRIPPVHVYDVESGKSVTSSPRSGTTSTDAEVCERVIRVY